MKIQYLLLKFSWHCPPVLLFFNSVIRFDCFDMTIMTKKKEGTIFCTIWISRHFDEHNLSTNHGPFLQFFSPIAIPFLTYSHLEFWLYQSHLVCCSFTKIFRSNFKYNLFYVYAAYFVQRVWLEENTCYNLF